MNILRYALLAVFGILGLVITLLVALALVLILKTEWIVNSKSANWALRKYWPQDQIQLSYDQFLLEILSDGWRHKKIIVALDGAKIDPVIKKSQVENLNVALIADLHFDWPFQVDYAIQNLVLHADNLALDLNDLPPSQDDSPFDLFKSIHPYWMQAHSLLSASNIDRLSVDIKQLSVVLKNGDTLSFKPIEVLTRDLEKSLHVKSLITLSKRSEDLQARPQFKEFFSTEARLGLQIVNDPTKVNPWAKLDLGALSISGKSYHAIQIDVLGDKDHYQLEAKTQQNLTISDKRAPLSLNLKALINQEKFIVESNGELDLPFVFLPRYNLRQLTITKKAPLTLEDRQSYEFASEHRLDIRFDPELQKKLEKTLKRTLPEYVTLDAQGEFWLAPYFIEREKEGIAANQRLPVVDVKFKMRGIEADLVSIQSQGNLRLEKDTNRYFAEPQGEISVDVTHFKGLAEGLNQFWLVVPAPFNDLDGKVHLKVGGPILENQSDFIIPVTFASQLAGERQKLFTQIKGDITVKNKTFKHYLVNLNTSLDDVRLSLPPFDPLRSIPPLVPDKRFVKIDRTSKSQSNLKINSNSSATPSNKIIVEYSVRIQQRQPLILDYPLFKPYIPLTADLLLQSEQLPRGSLATSPFAIEYLRRRIEVEKVVLTPPHPKEKDFSLESRFRVDQTNYKIYIEAKGKLTQPHITFRSEPYLPQSDIISVLLYDRTSDQLVGGDRENVGGVEAAVADRAIGLFGIWAFASTPIRSFSYDQNTKVYSANLKIDSQTTVTVGTDWEKQTNFEVRRRLSDHWMVVALLQPEQSDNQTGKIILQWENRYK